jgi:NitT/TauT family transport system permease protein
MFNRRLMDRLAVGALLILAWEVGSRYFGAYWVTPPVQTAQQAIHLFREGGLLRHTGYTLEAAALGFVIGTVPGIALPLWLRRHPLLLRILEPFLAAGYGLPKLALAPLFILWFGIGTASKVALVSSVVFFIIFFSTLAGVQGVDRRLLRSAQVMGASAGQLSRFIVWPAVLPHVFAGIRIATPYAIGGVIISELVSSNRGLGYLVQLGAMSFSTPDIFATVIAITALIGVSSWLTGRLERRLLRWQPSSDDSIGAGRGF